MQKIEGMEDLCIRRTRKQLQQAFLECTVEQGFAALTVRDITERAMVNRSTFYRHYQDKYDLLEQYMNEMYALLEDREGRVEHHPHEASSGFIDLLTSIQQEASVSCLVQRGSLSLHNAFVRRQKKACSRVSIRYFPHECVNLTHFLSTCSSSLSPLPHVARLSGGWSRSIPVHQSNLRTG